jgi:hypothetical protein
LSPPSFSVLILYNSTQTFTNTVWEHLESFRRISRHRIFYAHADAFTHSDIDLQNFDAVVIHYSIRLPYDQLHPSMVDALKSYRGAKAVFQQDEYDLTDKIRSWLETLAIDVMFTCVPEKSVAEIYDPGRFHSTRFVSNLTGYAPMDISHFPEPLPLGERQVLIGYRGRPLPYWYGALAQEKIGIARRMRAECEFRKLPVDIEWAESARIYGGGWYEFMRGCRAVLGTESGSNLFDDDGSVRETVSKAMKTDPNLTYDEAERRYFPCRDRPGLMNQVSPRIFEAATLQVGLVLFEGRYSGVVEPGRHFISLKKDFSNVDQVLRDLQDDSLVEEMTERTLNEVILSGRFGYPRFVEMVDRVLLETISARQGRLMAAGVGRAEQDGPQHTRPRPTGADDAAQQSEDLVAHALISTFPIRARPPGPIHYKVLALSRLWRRIPASVRGRVYPPVRAVVRRLIGH